MKTLFLYAFVFLSIFHHQSIIQENQKILLFFINQLLPSLFLLCVLIQLLPIPKLKIRFIHFFGIDNTTFYLIIKMILLGNPSNCYLVNQFVKEKQCSIAQAQRLIYCVNIPSISFMLMSIPFMTNHNIGLFLFFNQIFSIFVLLYLTRSTIISIQFHSKQTTLIEAFTFTLKSMAFILSYLFLIVSLKSLFLIYFPQLEMFFHLIMEFSSGVNYFSTSSNALLPLLICISFGGLCSHLQIISGCEESHLNYQKYLKYRIFQLLIQLSIYYLIMIFFYFFDVNIPNLFICML